MAKVKTKNKKASNWKSVTIFLLILGFGIGLLWVYNLYKDIYKPNVVIEGDKETFLYIPTGSDYNDVLKALQENRYVKDTASFNWLANKMEYPDNIKPGRYKIEYNMSNRAL
ncbi:MAG: endolytic transglycosylase MltG, partial [Bacteroidetes bacterium]|nr:endolytic transglycosylase MltG [Bacteroidota bacterium]